jgi:hypothetical protein
MDAAGGDGMNARTIGDLLMTFDPGGGTTPAAGERVVPFERRAAPATPPPRNDAAAKIDDAYERGKQDGRAAAIAECEDRLREYAAASAKRRADERERWVAEQSTVIADQLTSSWDRFEATFTGTLARLLEPFLAGAIEQQALYEFILHLEAVVRKPGDAALRIAGPSDLLEAIKAKVGGGSVALEYVTDTRCEVRLATDQAILETQMHAWIDRLKQTLP